MVMQSNENPNVLETISQAKKIREFMEKGCRIDGMQALDMFGTMKLASRISEIIAQGYDVQKDWKTLDNGKRVRVYWLLRPLDERVKDTAAGGRTID